MEPNYHSETELATREQQEFMRWRANRDALAQIKRISWSFALAFFLETLLLYVADEIVVTFWQAVDLLGVFNSATLWEFAQETFSVAYYLVAFLPPYLLFARLARFRLRDIPHSKPYAPVALASTGFAMGVSVAGSFVTGMALNFFEQFGLQPPQLPDTPVHPGAMALFLISTLVLAPVIEELVYRGILLGCLRRYGDGAAIVISSLIFGLAHGNMVQLPYSFILGMTLAFFVVKTNSIYTSMFIHFVNNAIATFLDLFMANLDDMMAYMVSSLELLVDVAVFVLAVVYLVGVRRADWKLARGNVPGGAVARQFFLTVPMAFALLVMCYNVLTSFT